MALPAGLMLGFQVGTIKNQYERNEENFTRDVHKAISESKYVYSLWNSHTSSAEDKASYNSIYTNVDSTFSVLIAQSAQPYPLLNFSPDTILPKIRKEQFLKFQNELELTRRKENKSLKEFYVLRSIQYCANCNEDSLSVAQIFPLDSLIKTNLKNNGVETKTHIAFYNKNSKNFSYLSEPIDTLRLSRSAYQFDFTTNESLVLDFPNKYEVIRAESMNVIVSSVGLILISFFCFGFAVHVLTKHSQFSKMKTDFINNVTHEFKTPIATINFALANIENDKVLQNPKAIKQFTEVIKIENKRLNGQVERVLQAASLNRKTLTLKTEHVDVHDILLKTINAFEIKLTDEDNLSSNFSAKVHTIKGDAFHLYNLFSNLLDNAIKYSRGTKEIRLETENKDNFIIIRCIDNGIGISDKNQKLIFDQFYRVPTGDVHTVKGFGLGLNYVKTIVKAHKGQIHLKSKVGQGSVFTILLPTDI